nr:GTP pyrophosphokinase [uncultured Blautia sp.]
MNKDQYYLYCQYVMGILTVKIKIIGEQLEHKYNREVIQNVSQRIKTPESIYAKMIRKGLKPDFSVAKEKLNDLIGIRIVCLFVDDVYEIAEMLKNQKDLTLIKEKDYIAKPKKSGYMSLHLIMKVPVCIDNKIETKTVEIQIRTTGMDFWSVLEYQLLYKKNVKGADKIGKELKGYSDEIASLDRKMLKLRNRIEAI